MHVRIKHIRGFGTTIVQRMLFMLLLNSTLGKVSHNINILSERIILRLNTVIIVYKRNQGVRYNIIFIQLLTTL